MVPTHIHAGTAETFNADTYTYTQNAKQTRHSGETHEHYRRK